MWPCTKTVSSRLLLGSASAPYLVELGSRELTNTWYAPSHCSTLQCVSVCWNYGIQIKRFIGEWKSERMNEWMNERTKTRTNNKAGVRIPIVRPGPPNVQSKYIILPVFFSDVVGCFEDFMPIFQPYRDSETGDNHSGIVAARPGIEPRSSYCSASQEFTTTPPVLLVFFSGILANRCLASSATVIVGPKRELEVSVGNSSFSRLNNNDCVAISYQTQKIAATRPGIEPLTSSLLRKPRA